MIYNTTYTNEEYTEVSQSIVGKPYSFIKKLRMNGIGSGRLIIAELSPKLQLFKQSFSELNYGNIELRPKGIIIHFTHRLERFSWIIPYYKLMIYNSRFFSIHADGHFMRFKKNRNYRENKTFIKKITTLKIEHLNLGYYDG